MTAEERRLDQQVTRDAEQEALAEIAGLGEQEGGGQAGPSDEVDHDWTRRMARALDPPPAHPPGALIGVDLARILKARLGDRVFVMTQTHDGMTAEVHLRVRGIIKTGTSLYDRHRVYMHLHDLQRLLRLNGRVHEIALVTRRAGLAPQVAEELRKRLGEAGLKVYRPKKDAGPPAGDTRDTVLVQSWSEIRPDIKTILQFNSVASGVMVFIIFIVAALGVVNSMLMAVFERTRELGMLKAIGMSGGGIVLLILLETTLLVLVSSTLGTGAGLGLDLLLVHHGIDLSAFSDGISVGGMGIKPVLHTSITTEGVVVPAVMLVVMCFLGAFYPSLRAARKRPAEGMREV
jgi:ABC-type lipoprotein release transport system permease subunit